MLQMQSNCPAAKGRLQFLFFSRQRRRKMLLRREPALKPESKMDDDLLCAEVSDRASLECRIENARSKLGWGITNI
jgi:hypothetical protein